MFLLVASQRPTELSKTVLSQCSNFVVHRIQNPDDLSQIRQMTPFISDAVLKRLPSLPKQHALVFGTSVNLPTTFEVREAFPRPHSDDTKVVDLWFEHVSIDTALRGNRSRHGHCRIFRAAGRGSAMSGLLVGAASRLLTAFRSVAGEPTEPCGSF
jgi:hypothetical protein